MENKRSSFPMALFVVLTGLSFWHSLLASPSKEVLFDSIEKMIGSEKYGEAISISKQLDVLSLSPDEKYKLNLKRGVCYYSLWNVSNAEASFRSALALSALASQPDLKKEEAIFHLGELFYSSRNYSKALESLEQLKSQYNSKSYPDYLYYLGKTYMELKLPAKARVCFDTITSSFSAHPKASLAQKLCASLPKQ